MELSRGEKDATVYDTEPHIFQSKRTMTSGFTALRLSMMFRWGRERYLR